jgi:ribose transport system ATP-binding protein
MSGAAFVATGLDKRFPGVRALSGVNLRLEAGSIHALLGENGAGKSTLIKIMTGVYRPDGGEMAVRGEPVTFHRPLEAARAGIGAVHQERNLVPAFTVGENIMLQDLPARGWRVDRATVRARARESLELLGADLDPDAPVTGLSVAQRQLVEIAKALALDSAVLLLDEPTASITADEADRLFAVVRRLAAQGHAVLFVSHKLEEVFALCDTATVLRDGRSVLEGAPVADLDKDAIVEQMVGRAHAALSFAARPPATGGPVLELDGIATASGHRDVSLAVHAGEILGLYGLVGAGRSELAKAVLGLDRINAGEVRVHGRRARIRDVGDALRRHRIGYVTENRKEEGLFLDQAIPRNVAVTVWDRLRTRLGAVPRRAERRLAEEYIDRLGIRVSSPRQMAGQLSGGNQQKVSLAKWLAADTEILIIDEPTVGIDVRTKAAFHHLIWDLAGQGLAILLISSDLPEMVTLADRIIVMRDYAVCGEVANDHRYDEISQAVIRLIHGDAAGAAAA